MADEVKTSSGPSPQRDRFGLVGHLLEGKFQVERVVAEGGFGVVYRARHTRLDSPVALKVLKAPPDLSEDALREFLDRFQQEAKTIAKIRHPGVVGVVDFGTAVMPKVGEAAYMVLEWIDGHTLEDDLKARRSQGGRTPEEAMKLIRPAFEAVEAAHRLGFAHRDLKPANLMIVEGTIRLLDFGIAKSMQEGETAGSGATRTGSMAQAFSPRYASPEQLSGARSGPWTDVHALGLILTELLTDRTAYRAQDLTGLYAEALSSSRPTPAAAGVDVGQWEDVLKKGMALRPDDRYRTAGEFLAALDAALSRASHAPLSATMVAAPPPNPLETTNQPVVRAETLAPAAPPKPSPRNNALIAVPVLVVTLGIAGVATLAGRRASTPTPNPPTHAAITAPASPDPTPVAHPANDPPTPPPTAATTDAAAAPTADANANANAPTAPSAPTPTGVTAPVTAPATPDAPPARPTARPSRPRANPTGAANPAHPAAAHPAATPPAPTPGGTQFRVE